MTRAKDLCSAAKLAALDRLGPDADDAAITNCACEMLAEYAARLELDAHLRAPWDPPPSDPDPIDVAELREERYEAQLRREGREP